MVPFSGEVRSYVYSTGNFPVALTWQIIQPLSLISCVWLSTIFPYCRALSRFSFHRRLSRIVLLNSVPPKIQLRIGNQYIFLSIPIHFRPTFFFVTVFHFLSYTVSLVYFSCKSDIQLFICTFLNENKDDNLFVHIYYKQILETDIMIFQ